MARTLAQLTGLWNEKDRKKRKKGEAERPGNVWEKREKEKETHAGIGTAKAGHWGEGKVYWACRLLALIPAIDAFVHLGSTGGTGKRVTFRLQLDNTAQVQGRREGQLTPGLSKVKEVTEP